MKRTIATSKNRRGAMVPLFAILLIPLVGMMAFSIDVGYMVVVQTELQNAADAAALAGAEKLQDLFVQYYLPQQTQQQDIYTTATTDTGVWASPVYTAKQFASYNTAGNVNIELRDVDITFSYITGSASQPSSYPTVFPNTITVVARRDRKMNGPLDLFFGGIFGRSTVNMTASASATIYAGDVSSLQVIPGVEAHILPVALDVNYWKNFYQTGQSPDGTVVAGPNGAPQLHIYPYPGNAPGSFGLIDVGHPANNTPAFRKWIDNGETPNDIKYLLNSNLLPVSPTNGQWWKCGPGMTSTLTANFQSVMGQANLIPLFQPVSQNPYQAAQNTGSSATYDIICFVGVTVTQATASGSNMDISVQPMAVVDPTAVILNPQPAGPTILSAAGTYQTTFVSAKLTQ